MLSRERILQSLETSIESKYEKIGELSTLCEKHDLASHPNADSCPCQAELYWEIDRLDESLFRLKVLKISVVKWYTWYIRSSTKSPGFPKESIRVWSQTPPITAWQKYGVAHRNGRVDPTNHGAYEYFKHSNSVLFRPAASVTAQGF